MNRSLIWSLVVISALLTAIYLIRTSRTQPSITNGTHTLEIESLGKPLFTLVEFDQMQQIPKTEATVVSKREADGDLTVYFRQPNGAGIAIRSQDAETNAADVLRQLKVGKTYTLPLGAPSRDGPGDL